MRAAVDQMGRQNREQFERPPTQVLEADRLEHHIACRIGSYVLGDPIASMDAGVDQFMGRYPILRSRNAVQRVALLFGKEIDAITDDEPEIADADLVDARIIDFVEDAVAVRKPNPAERGQSGADPVFIA